MYCQRNVNISWFVCPAHTLRHFHYSHLSPSTITDHPQNPNFRSASAGAGSSKNAKVVCRPEVMTQGMKITMLDSLPLTKYPQDEDGRLESLSIFDEHKNNSASSLFVSYCPALPAILTLFWQYGVINMQHCYIF